MNILDEIISVKKEEIVILKREYSFSRFSDTPHFNKSRKSLWHSLSNDKAISVISEIKKASPSKGIIRENFDHLRIAQLYIENGADAISILTDKNFFQGNIRYLSDIADISTIPLLRKDFILDEYQVLEAKSNGADAILLIAENLSANQIDELTTAAKENDLEVLLEIHSNNQLGKINFDLNKIIGINNRNLENFVVDLSTTTKISKLVPDSTILVSESGIASQADIKILMDTNVNAILVGEHLMRQNDPGQALKELISWCSNDD